MYKTITFFILDTVEGLNTLSVCFSATCDPAGANWKISPSHPVELIPVKFWIGLLTFCPW